MKGEIPKFKIPNSKVGSFFGIWNFLNWNFLNWNFFFNLLNSYFFHLEFQYPGRRYYFGNFSNGFANKAFANG